MKKLLTVLVLGLGFGGSLVSADGIKDNRLEIESNRIEENVNREQMGQNPLVSGLFGQEDQQKIAESQSALNGRFSKLQQELFVDDYGQVKETKQGALFTNEALAKDHLLASTPTVQLESLDTTLIYSGLCLLVFGGAIYVTHRMSKE